MSSKHGKQVYQSTFDAIVREGIEEFGLCEEEAVADACEQLRKSGVTDFSNLDVSTPFNPSECQTSESYVNTTREALHSRNTCTLIESLSSLKSSITDKRDVATAVSSGIMELLPQCMAYSLEFQGSRKLSLVRCVSELILTICGQDELHRSAFVNLANGLESMKAAFESLKEPEPQKESSVYYFETCTALVQSMCSVQRNNEQVKQYFAANGCLESLVLYFEGACSAIISNDEDKASATKLFAKLCFCVRQLLSPDDTSAKVSETFNRARVLAGSHTVTESGLRPLETSSNLLELFSTFMGQVQATASFSSTTKRHLQTECIACIRTCCVSDEICSQIINLNLHQSCVELLQHFRSDEYTVNVCVGLLRNLAGRDECKGPIFGSMMVLTEVVKQHLSTSPRICEQYCGLAASLCLRRPDLANKMVKTEVIKVVLDAMEIYDEDRSLQRVGCLALRNMCARDMEARRHLRQQGLAEKLVRRTWKRHTNCDDVAYAALRDMDVLKDKELRRDERYTMPTSFYNTPIIRESD